MSDALATALLTLAGFFAVILIGIGTTIVIETIRYQRRRRAMPEFQPWNPARDPADWAAFVGKVEALNQEMAAPLGFTMYSEPNMPTYFGAHRIASYAGQYRIYIGVPGDPLRHVFPDHHMADVYDPEVGRQALAAAVAFLLRAE